MTSNKDISAMFMVLNGQETDGTIQAEYRKNSQVFNIRIYDSLVGDAEIQLSRFDARELAKALLAQLEEKDCE